ncbi:MAG TPA: ATP-binding protein [Gemmatimonadaceae bacterium]|nr:ATP-binding protein [Gemmatimonadaceae bacterium]
MFDPRRVLRWIYIGRLSLATAIFVAALVAWRHADASDTLVATLTLIGAAAFTGWSIWWSLPAGRLGTGFYYLQAFFNVALVTIVVQLTGGALSLFAPLYILVIVGASLLLPAGGGLVVALLGNAAYFADVILSSSTNLSLALLLQLAVIALVALAVAYLAARLREAGVSREALEARLEMQKLQAEDILKNIRSGIVTIDSRGRMLFANPTSGKLLGFDAESVRGRPVREVFASTAPALVAALERAVESRERVTRGEAAITVHGRTFPIGLTTTTIDADGTHDGISATAIFQDITDNKRLEELRLRAERLEAVAELSASLAHEIKNPLASIRSAVEQLARRPKANEDERTLGRLIVRESDRLSRLLSEFLDFARVRVTQGARVDMNGIARTAAGLASAHPDKKRGVHIVYAAPTEPVLVEGDEDLLHRAVFNIALNAVQAAREEGEVRINLSRLPREQIPVGVPFTVDAASLSVSDDGPGIPLEIRDRVFDPFFTTKPGGTGLGLPIAHRAIEAHRGFVFVESSTKGTRFTVLLPLAQPAGTAELA